MPEARDRGPLVMFGGDADAACIDGVCAAPPATSTPAGSPSPGDSDPQEGAATGSDRPATEQAH